MRKNAGRFLLVAALIAGIVVIVTAVAFMRPGPLPSPPPVVQKEEPGPENIVPQDIATAPPAALPAYEEKEPKVKLFVDLRPVTVTGYDGDVMEPFIARGGRMLFFNSSHAPDASTHIHYAARETRNRFRYLGELQGVIGPAKDMAPAMDGNDRFYFTSTRSYAKDRKTIYTGKFNGNRITDVKPVSGDIVPDKTGEVDMDCAVTQDGKTMVLSRAQFVSGISVPQESDLMIARRKGSAFNLLPNSDSLMKNVNSPALEYAPDISPDVLTLYFTRASAGENGKVNLRIMVATRKNVKEPFDKPSVVSIAEGLVEAPAVPLGAREILFHKKDGDRTALYQAISKTLLH